MFVKKAILLVFLFIFCFSIDVFSQDTPVQTPQVQPAPDFPSYIVKPTEDLNPYGLSSIGETTGNEYNTNKSTITPKSGNRSNADINKAIEERKKNEEQENQSETNEEGNTTTTTTDEAETFEFDEPEVEQENFSEPAKSTQLIYWKDDKGNMHVTNDIAKVPPKFIDTVEYK